MPQKWAFFAIGGMAGTIAVFAFALLLEARQPTALAAPAPVAIQDSDAKAGILLSPGGSQQNLQDICWVLYKRPNTKSTDAGGDGKTTDTVLNKQEILSLACYQVGNNGRYIRLVGVRDVSYDMDILELKNEKPTVREIVKELRDQEKKEKDKKP